MDQSDGIPRGSLGEVTGVDGEERSVKFPEKAITVSATKLNVSDFQKDSFVHSRGGSDDLIGEVKDLVDGKLVINFYGETVETKSEKAKYLIKSQFQPGMFVFWRKADDDIPSGHVGEVLDSIDDGKVKVKFPNGSWRFRLRDLVRCNVQPGSYVQWTKSDEDVEEGEIGKVTGLEWNEFIVNYDDYDGLCKRKTSGSGSDMFRKHSAMKEFIFGFSPLVSLFLRNHLFEEGDRYVYLVSFGTEPLHVESHCVTETAHTEWNDARKNQR